MTDPSPNQVGLPEGWTVQHQCPWCNAQLVTWASVEEERFEFAWKPGGYVVCGKCSALSHADSHALLGRAEIMDVLVLKYIRPHWDFIRMARELFSIRAEKERFS